MGQATDWTKLYARKLKQLQNDSALLRNTCFQYKVYVCLLYVSSRFHIVANFFSLKSHSLNYDNDIYVI